MANPTMTFSHDLPQQMKALLLTQFRDAYALRHDVPLPAIEPGRMLVKVKRVGLCHTDLLVREGAYHGSLPMIPGHETVGTVVALGKGVEGFAAGDRVGLSVFFGACGKCNECVTHSAGVSNYCPSVRLAGLNAHGGLAEYALADPRTSVLLPPSLFSFSQEAKEEETWSLLTPTMCAASTAYNSLLNARKTLGSVAECNGIDASRLPSTPSVGVVGLGGVGLMAVQLAKTMKERFGPVAGFDTRAAPRALTSSLPGGKRPDVVADATRPIDELRTEVQRRLNGRDGLDVVLVCTDSLDGFKLATELLATHGVLVAIGQPKEGQVSFHWRSFVARDIRVIPGCLGDKQTVEEMMRLIASEGLRRFRDGKEGEAGLFMQVREVEMEGVEAMIKEFEGKDMIGKFVVRIH